jgi:molybdopterin-guanine dinucleotide biosynthesis protein A
MDRQPVKIKPSDECGICILAGGLSERMGRNKARLRLGGQTLLQRIKAVARSTGLSMRIIRRDLIPRCGPLGGIYTGLKTSQAAAEIFLACDMPFVSERSLIRLVEEWKAGGKPVFFKTKRTVRSAHAIEAGFPFLLPVLALRAVERQLDREQFSLQQLARVLRARCIRPLPGHNFEFFNVNTPSEWRRARQLWRA